jgi:hypothetical protein
MLLFLGILAAVLLIIFLGMALPKTLKMALYPVDRITSMFQSAVKGAI